MLPSRTSPHRQELGSRPPDAVGSGADAQRVPANSVLLVSYFFPPAGGIGLPGAQRALKLAKHLPARGWRPVILSVRESSYEPYLAMDRALLARVPAVAVVERARVLRGLTPLLRIKAAVAARWRRPGAEPPAEPVGLDRSAGHRNRYQRLKDALTDLFEIPDQEIGWLLPGIVAGWRAVHRHQVDVIYATGRPWTGLVIGLALKRLTGKPLVVEFRDPWMTNPFRIVYSALKDRLDAWLEQSVIRGADLIVTTTSSLRAELIERFGASIAPKCVTLLGGIDRDDAAPQSAAARRPDDGFVLTHAGFLYSRRDPAGLLDALELLRERGLIRSGRFRCELIGRVELTYDLAADVRRRGLEGLVVLRGEVPHAESLAALAACDVALLLQPGTGTQIPSKLYEYVAAGRQTLAIVDPNGAAAELVREHGLGLQADAADAESIAAAIEAYYLAWEQTGKRPEVAADVAARFDIRTRVAELSAHLTRLAAQR